MNIYKSALLLLVLMNLGVSTYLVTMSTKANPVASISAPSNKTKAAERCERMTALLNGGSPSEYEERCRKAS